MISKIIIGTANFGSKYGHKNFKIHEKEILNIMKFCKKKKIKSFDTASSYRNSEKILGKFNLSNFLIYSKIPKIPTNVKNIEKWVYKKFFKSLANLKVKKIEGIYLHNQEDILTREGKTIYQILKKLKKKGYVKKIGVSVYDYKKLIEIVKIYNLDMVQIPINIFDRRFLNKELLKLLIKKKIQINVRSIFLQGILLSKQEKLDKKFMNLDQTVFKKWYKWLDKKKIDNLDACISFIKSLKGVSKIIIGINDLNQLKMIISSLKKIKSFPYKIYSDKIKLIDIRKW